MIRLAAPTVLLALAHAPALAGLPAAAAGFTGELQVLGRGSMHWLGLAIYEAALWVPPGAGWSPDAVHALEIRYARAISAERLVDTSLAEMSRLGMGDAHRRVEWRATLAAALPSVAAGDTLVGVHLPGVGARFWHGERATGAITDPELARAFFGIWLDPRTREPALRARLLGLP